MIMARRRSALALGAARGHLLGAKSVYIACHILPDGDATGSMLALGRALRYLGKSCSMACADTISRKYDFLPDWTEIVSRPPAAEEVLVTVDCSDVERLGTLYETSAFSSRPVINIDHHITNTGFGTVNVVEHLPSTAEIVYSLIKNLEVPVDQPIASALLTGLVTDTRCFRTGNVTARQLRTAMALMGAGASLAQINELVYNREPLSTVCLWGKALASVETRGRIIWTEINRDMMRRCRASPNEGNGLVSFLASTMGVDVAIVFREQDDGLIEVSMRAGPGWDVSGAAFRLGGGGHPRAAGCTIAESMPAARKRVLAEIEVALRQQESTHAAEDGDLTSQHP
jgi:phosphoesterase RecJ-like protein